MRHVFGLILCLSTVAFSTEPPAGRTATPTPNNCSEVASSECSFCFFDLTCLRTCGQYFPASEPSDPNPYDTISTESGDALSFISTSTATPTTPKTCADAFEKCDEKDGEHGQIWYDCLAKWLTGPYAEISANTEEGTSFVSLEAEAPLESPVPSSSPQITSPYY